jgi:hypothetical protein
MRDDAKLPEVPKVAADATANPSPTRRPLIVTP